MIRWYKRLFILPHYLLGIAWLLATAGLLYPYFWLTGFRRERLFAFFKFQGAVVYTLMRPVVNGIEVVKKDFDDTARLFTANHQSIMDVFVFTRLDIRRVVFVAKHWPFRIPFYGRYLREMGFINTNETDFAELRTRVKELLAAGISVVFFPEGTRRRELGRFHSMAFHVAVDLGVPVTPVCIKGHNEMLPPKGRMPRPAKLRYTILPAVGVTEFADDTGALRLARAVRNLIAAELLL